MMESDESNKCTSNSIRFISNTNECNSFHYDESRNDNDDNNNDDTTGVFCAVRISDETKSTTRNSTNDDNNKNNTRKNDCDNNDTSKEITSTERSTLTNSNTTINEDNDHDSNSTGRLGLLIFSSLYTFLFAGAFFGWGPMQLMLEKNGSYSSKCPNNNPTAMNDYNNITSTTNSNSNNYTYHSTDVETDDDEVCSDQTAALLRVQYVGLLTILLSPIAGFILDKFGTMVLVYLMTILVFIALVSLGIAAHYMIDPLLFVAFIHFGAVAYIMNILTVQTGVCLYNNNEYKRSQVISFLNTLFDAGGVTYLILWSISNAANWPLSLITVIYAAIAIICFTGGIYCWRLVLYDNSKSEQPLPLPALSSPLQDNKNVNIDLSDARSGEEYLAGDTQDIEAKDSEPPTREVIQDVRDANNNTVKVDEGIERTNNNSDALRHTSVESHHSHDQVFCNSNDAHGTNGNRYIKIANRTPRQQLLSEPFIMLSLYFALHVAYNLYTLTTTRDFLGYLGDDEVNNKYLTIFTSLLPLSVIGLPFVDQIIKRFGFYGGFLTINFLSLSNSVVKLTSSNLNVQIIGFIIFTFYRCFLFSITLSYLPKLVSNTVIGTGAGIMSFLAGVTNFINYPVSMLAVKHMEGNFFVSNLIIALLVIPCCFAAWRISITIKNEDKADEDYIKETAINER